MPRNAMQGQWQGTRDSVVVPEESPRHRESSRTNLQVLVLRLVLKFLQTQYDNYDYDASESRWRRQETLATSQTEEGIC